MTADFLKQVFDPVINLNIQVWENFEKLGRVRSFPKESILKPSNTTEKYLNIIIEGCGGNFLWKKNNFVCIDIAFEKEFLNDYMSFTLQKVTPIEVKLFENTTVFQISYNNFRKTMEVGNYGEKITRLIAENSFIEKQKQQVDLLTKTAKERYLELLYTKPDVNKIPLKYLASYLGITPQSLSRIRGEKV